MPEDVTRMIASVGFSIAGSGTVSTRTSWLPCQVSALIRWRYPNAPRPSARIASRSPRRSEVERLVVDLRLGDAGVAGGRHHAAREAARPADEDVALDEVGHQ